MSSKKNVRTVQIVNSNVKNLSLAWQIVVKFRSNDIVSWDEQNIQFAPGRL